MPVPIQTADYSGIWRGLMRRRRVIDHSELYAQEALNVELRGNVLAKRMGVRQISETPLGIPPPATPGLTQVFALFNVKWRRNSGGTDHMIAVTPLLIQKVGDPPSANVDTSGLFPPGQGSRSTPQFPVNITQFDNMVFIVDGTNPNRKYRISPGGQGVRTEAIGIIGPTVPPTLSLLAGPGITAVAGGWRYAYTYVNSATQAESEPSGKIPDPTPPEQAAIKPNNQIVRVAFTASPDPQVDKVRIYRTRDGGATYFFLAELADTAGFYDDKTTDLALPDSDPMDEFVNYPPPTPMRLIVPWVQANRLIGVANDTPSILRYSDLALGQLKPEAWPALNQIFVAVDSGDEIVGIFPFTDSVLIFCHRSIFRLRGVPPDDLTLDPVQWEDDTRTAIGSFGQKSLVQVDDSVVNPFLDGAYAVNRYIDTAGGFENARLSRPIDDLWAELNPAAIQWTHGVFLRERKQVRLWIPNGSNNLPTRALVYQLDVDAEQNAPAGWTIWDVQKAGASSVSSAVITASCVVETPTGDVVYVATNDGMVGVMDDGLQDFWYVRPDGSSRLGADYHFLWQSVPVTFAEDGRETRLRFVDVVWSANTETTLLCVPVTDFGVTWPVLSFALQPLGSFILDISKLDLTRLGTETARREFRGSALNRGTFQAFMWVVFGPADFAIEGWTARWQPLALKSEMVDAVQVLPEPPGGGLGFGEGEFGEGGFGGRP